MHHTDSALTAQCGQTPWSQRKPDRAAERAAKYIPLAVNRHYYIKHFGGYGEFAFLKNTVIMLRVKTGRRWKLEEQWTHWFWIPKMSSKGKQIFSNSNYGGVFFSSLDIFYCILISLLDKRSSLKYLGSIAENEDQLKASVPEKMCEPLQEPWLYFYMVILSENLVL